MPASKPMNYVRACMAFGNGDIGRGREILFAVATRLEEARRKHKWPAEAYGKYQALGVIGAEYQELVHAVEKESSARMYDEALDVIATTVRLYGGEHKPKKDNDA